MAVNPDLGFAAVNGTPLEATPGRGAFRLAPGIWLWQGEARDRMRVRLQFAPGAKIEVDIWWNRADGNADIQLIFGLYARSVELGCLQGNGFNAPGLHRAGFGTLAVNVAVQALQSACDPALRVEGVLSNTDEIGLPEDERLRLEANRRAFWRRFGLGVVRRGAPGSEYDYLQGRVADLHTVNHGTIGGQFARCIPLEAFARA
jgi:hypothetical protein